MSNKITCTCGHSWNKSSSSKKDMKICHVCGKDNTMQNGGWLDSYDEELQLGGYVYPTNYVPQAQKGYPTGDIASLPGVRKQIPLSKEELARNKKAVEERVKAKNAKILADRQARIKASEAAKKKPMSAKTLAEQTQATGDKFRLFPNDPNSFIDDYLNPGVAIGNMASGLGSIPYDVQQGNYGKAAMSVAVPLVTGALGGIGAKNAKEFANNLVNPLAGLKDAAKDVYSKVKGGSPKTNIKDFLSKIDNDYEVVDPETGFSKIIYDLNIDDQLSGLSKDYTKTLPNDNAYREWADIIYPKLSESVSPAELKAAHEKSLEYFKGSILTGSGGKEHGLFIRNLLSEKIPQFNNPIIRDAKGNQLTQFNLGAHSTDIPIESEIKELLDKSGYDVSKLTANDWNIIDAYSKGYDNSINQLLRGKLTSKGAPSRGALKFYGEQADVLKETILKNKAKEPFQTVRGVYDYPVDLLDSKTYEPIGLTKLRSQLEKGDIFKDESFLSTAIARNKNSSFGTANASEIIDIPGGGVQSIGIPEASSYPQYPGEREVILPPGLIRKVEEVEDLNSPLTKGYRFRTSILNPYAVTGAIAAGAAAAQQKRNGGYIPQAQNGIEGTMGGLTDQGFDYNGAWGGTMEYGGDIPQAQNGWLDKLSSKLNPYNWGVEDYSKEKDFNKAYSTAKKSGEKEFMYKGERYNTKYAGTPRQEVGAYGVDGKPVNIKEASDPSQVNLYPAFGKYLPGHVSASVTSDSDAASVDYSSTGNNPFGLSKVKNKGEHTYYVYGADQDKFYEKAAALPTGDYMLEDKYTPSDWNLFTNNCADNVCDAFGIPRSKGIQTPSGAVSKIKNKYPTLDVTGRTSKDYSKLVEDVNEKDVLKNSEKLTSIYFSPDTDSELKKDIGLKLQKALRNSGYDLPKSYIKGNKWNVDKIIGDETLNALKDWKSKNKSLAMGGSLPGSVGFTYARTAGAAPSNGPYAKKTKASAQNGMEMKFYQEGLDWTPKNISRDGSEIPQAQAGFRGLGPITPDDVSRFFDLFSIPQKAVTKLVTGKYQTPSEAMNIKNPVGAFAVDAVLDPANIVGGTAAAKIAKGVKAAKAVNSVAKKVKPNFKSEIDWGKWNSEIPSNQALMQEYNAIEQASKAKGTWMKNPDGSAFKGTPEQFVQQNSQNFKKAFPEGYEKTYRGGNNESFVNTSHPIVFTGDVNTAKNYVGSKNPFTGDYTVAKPGVPDGRVLYDFYAPKSKNSITIDNKGKSWREIDRKHFGDTPPERDLHNSSGDYTSTDDIAKWMVQNNKDNVRLNNIFDSYDADFVQIMNHKPGNYLKSAVGNNGMFDMTNPNIYKSILPYALPAAIGAGAIQQKKKGGKVKKDDNGYWNPDNWGEPVEINSNEITMQGVDQDLIGISDAGDVKHMKANSPNNYKFKGKKVTEYPVKKNGGWLEKWK